MADQAKENLNIEANTPGALDSVKKFEVGKSKLSDKEIQEATIKAAELTKLEKNFETDTTKNIPQEKAQQVTPQINATIDALNRPEAAEGIKNSYSTVEQEIAKSDQDKNPIARGLGKLLKRTLGQ